MKLIFTRKQEKQKNKIINNIQTDLLYKLVINYLDLKEQDKNQLENKYIIDQFDALEKILDIVDKSHNDELNNKSMWHKINKIGLPLELEKMDNYLKQNPYYESIFDHYIYFLKLLFDEETQNTCFLEIYNLYEEYNEKKNALKQEMLEYPTIQKAVKHLSNKSNMADLSNLVNKFFQTHNSFI